MFIYTNRIFVLESWLIGESRNLRKTYPSQKISRLENKTSVPSYPLTQNYILNAIDRFQEPITKSEITVIKAAKSEAGPPIQENISIVRNSNKNDIQPNLKAIFVHVG